MHHAQRVRKTLAALMAAGRPPMLMVGLARGSLQAMDENMNFIGAHGCPSPAWRRCKWLSSRHTHSAWQCTSLALYGDLMDACLTGILP